jgi:hypothetical protein
LNVTIWHFEASGRHTAAGSHFVFARIGEIDRSTFHGAKSGGKSTLGRVWSPRFLRAWDDAIRASSRT